MHSFSSTKRPACQSAGFGIGFSVDGTVITLLGAYVNLKCLQYWRYVALFKPRGLNAL